MQPGQCFVFPDDKAIARMSRSLGIDFEYDHEQARLLLDCLSHPLPDGYQHFVNPQGDFYYVKDGVATQEDPRVSLCKRRIKQLESDIQAEEKSQFEVAIQGAELKGSQNVVTGSQPLLPKLLQEAYSFYVSLYGDIDAEDIEPVQNVPRFFQVTPEQVTASAESTFGLSLPDEVGLLWIVRQYVASPLPPRWRFLTNPGRNETGGVIPEGFVYDAEDEFAEEEIDTLEHPAQGYFKRLVESARDEIELQEDGFLLDEEEDVEFRSGVLPFMDKEGRRYNFDFFTKEIRYDLSNKDEERSTENETGKEEKEAILLEETGLEVDAEEEENADEEEEDGYFVMPESQISGLVSQERAVMWKALQEHVSEADFLSYTNATNVIPRDGDTEFLPDIVRVLLSLPVNWIRRNDFNGKPHFCSVHRIKIISLVPPNESSSRQIRDMLSKIKHLKAPACEWTALPRHRPSAPRVLQLFQSSACHPLAFSERQRIAQLREDTARQDVVARIQKRNDARMEALRLRGSKSKARLHRVIPSVKLDPQEAAYEHYVRIYGLPHRAKCATFSAHVTAGDIIKKARYYGINAKRQPYLLWVVQAQLSSGLPRQWRKSVGTYEYREEENVFETKTHPSDVYFAAVLWTECKRVQRLNAGARACLERFRWLEFIEAGKTHYYDFVTGERTFDSSKPQFLIHQSAPFILSAPSSEIQNDDTDNDRILYEEAVEVHQKIMQEGLLLKELHSSVEISEEESGCDGGNSIRCEGRAGEGNEENESALGEAAKRADRIAERSFAVVKIHDEHIKRLMSGLMEEESDSDDM